MRQERIEEWAYKWIYVKHVQKDQLTAQQQEPSQNHQDSSHYFHCRHNYPRQDWHRRRQQDRHASRRPESTTHAPVRRSKRTQCSNNWKTVSATKCATICRCCQLSGNNSHPLKEENGWVAFVKQVSETRQHGMSKANGTLLIGKYGKECPYYSDGQVDTHRGVIQSSHHYSRPHLLCMPQPVVNEDITPVDTCSCIKKSSTVR